MSFFKAKACKAATGFPSWHPARGATKLGLFASRRIHSVSPYRRSSDKMLLTAILACKFSQAQFYLVDTWQRNFTGNFSTDGSADVLNEFFSSTSMGMNGQDGDGLDHGGNYIVNGSMVKNYGIGQTSSADPKASLSAWPLTFAAGHPHYSSATGPGNQRWGLLSGGSWGAFVRNTATRMDLSAHATGKLKQSVLVVENNALVASGPKPMYLGGFSQLQLYGIVVRRGGILLIDDADLDLSITFMIIESGGLFQAGSHADAAYRFMSQLTITLTHQEDYGSSPVTASQYSAEVLFPGLTLQGPGSNFEDYSGGSLHNTGGAKAIAVFFNGNYQLNGFVPALVDYRDTWNAVEVDSNGNIVKDWREYIQPLTTSNSNGTGRVQQDFDLNSWPEAYPMIWARLASPGAKKGDTVISLEEADWNANAVLAGKTWAVGDRILITARTSQYTDSSQALGMPRVWMDYDPSSPQASTRQSYHDNVQANAKFKPLMGGNKDGEVGVEVATIAALGADGKITLARPLMFDHGSTDTSLKNDQGRMLNVQTRLHVGWLSRRITITSQRSSGGGGCNNIPSTANKPINGPMGKVVPNFSQISSIASETEIYNKCYDSKKRQGSFIRPDGQGGFFDTVFTGPQETEQQPVGHWMFETSGLTGCNAIWGGQQRFMYASSVSLDGVEVTNMGTSGNFGNMGQYAVHFHLAGYGRSFRDYLPTGAKALGYSRELRIVNSAVWRTYGRWITLHGTNEAEIRNNVAFLTYGSGFFVEDGTELQNIFDHNMGIMAMTAVRNAYWNPSPIYPFVSTDFGPMSTFWFKNNQNIFSRNIAANSPTPVLAVWYVPQKIGRLRGPSAVCIGSEILGLPSLASEASATGTDTSGLNRNLESNNNGFAVKFESIRTCGQDGSSYCACYMPPDFEFPLRSPMTGCNVYSADNQGNPLMANSENVVYNMVGFYSEFPEGISGGPLVYDYTNLGVPPGVVGVGKAQQFNNDSQAADAPGFLPAAGQNDCTDGSVAIGIYPTPGWAPSLAYQPLTPGEYTTINNQCNVQSGEPTLGAKQIPKIIANLLTYNIGTVISGLFYGPGWSKDVPPFLINCAFLTDYHDATTFGTVPVGNGLAQSLQVASTNFIWGYNLPDTAMPGTFGVYRNLITNGGLTAVPHPNIFIGHGTFMDSATVFGGGSVEGSGVVSQDAPTYNYFFSDLAGSVDEVFGNLWYNVVAVTVTNSQYGPASLQLIDLDAGVKKQINLASASTIQNWTRFGLSKLKNSTNRKYPYLCGGSSDAWGLFLDNTTLQQPVISYVLGGLFDSDVGRAVGNEICRVLSWLPPRLPPIDSTGKSQNFLIKQREGQPPACGVPTVLNSDTSVPPTTTIAPGTSSPSPSPSPGPASKSTKESRKQSRGSRKQSRGFLENQGYGIRELQKENQSQGDNEAGHKAVGTNFTIAEDFGTFEAHTLLWRWGLASILLMVCLYVVILIWRICMIRRGGPTVPKLSQPPRGADHHTRFPDYTLLEFQQ
eukprot:g853.t1